MRKKIVFEIVFISTLLLLGAVTFFTLCASHGHSQQDIFFQDKGIVSDTFMDFFNNTNFVHQRDPYHGDPAREKIYPPLAYVFFYPASRIVDYSTLTAQEGRQTQLGIMSVVLYIVFISVTLAVLLYELKRGSKLIRFLTVLALFVSGIFLCSLERGNLIYVSVVGLLFFVMFYKHKNPIFREFSYLALAIAAGLKIYPAIFGVLLLYEKRYWDAFRLMLYGIVIFFVPFLFFKGGFANISLMLKCQASNMEYYRLLFLDYRFGWLPYTGVCDLRAESLTQLCIYSPGVAVATAWSLKRPWKISMLLTCAVIFAYFFSAYHCGLYLFIPIIMFLNEKTHPATDWWYLLGIILILNPYQLSYDSSRVTPLLANLGLTIIYIALCLEGIVATVHTIFKRRFPSRLVCADKWFRG
jgi:hypothetical protein